MYFIKDLVEKYHDVWVRCDDKHLQRLFLLQAECEGFLTVNGQKPTELNCQELYGISADMTMGYLSSMIWSLTKKKSVRQSYKSRFWKVYIRIGCDDNHR